MLYDYLMDTYGENEPIFVSEIQYEKQSTNYIRQQIKRMTDSGLLKRYDTGIYFIPKKSIFRSGSQLSRNTVIDRKYLRDQGKRCGYVSGVMFANQLGLTTQVPGVCEVVTNKASNDYRETTLASAPVIIRRPRVPVTEDNYRKLQLLDLVKDIDFYSETSGQQLTDRVLSFMRKYDIRFSDLTEYLPYYPDKVYRNMFEMGLLRGISA